MSETSVTALTGHLDNLTADEEAKLQEAWAHLLRLCGVEAPAPGRRRAPAVFRERLWAFVLADEPDVLVLRFLRARKWDVARAVAMLVSAVAWRHERRLEADVIRRGDGGGPDGDGGDGDGDGETPDDHGAALLAQYRSGKAYVRGSDRDRRPVFVIRVRLHDPKRQPAEAMERFVLHTIETIRATLRYPREKACLVFDLTGFGLKNMDFHVVRFLVQVFEARYPEYLGVVLVHNAPFVFWDLDLEVTGAAGPEQPYTLASAALEPLAMSLGSSFTSVRVLGSNFPPLSLLVLSQPSVSLARGLPWTVRGLERPSRPLRP
ncbi:hypothetical protein VTH06DRAFT_7547 [Thermothelomyces fergusii]